MDSLGIGLIGCGRAGMVHARNFCGRVPAARLVALVDASRQAAAAAANELRVGEPTTDIDSVLSRDDVQAVIVATPTVLHRDIVVAAAGAGKHVLCEKPMAMTIAECADMIRAAERARVVLQIAFMRRFDAAFLAAREAVRAGQVGSVVLVKSLSRGPSVPQPWMFDLGSSNGTLAEVNSHDIDTLRWFTGSEVAEVYAMGGNFRSPQALPAHPDYYDNVVLAARFENGMQGLIDGAAAAAYGYDARLEVLGTRGVVFAGALAENSVVSCTRDEGLAQGTVRSWRALFRDAYEAEDRSFVECIRDGSPPRVGGRDGMMAVSVVCAGNESIRTGKPVRPVVAQ
jgi:predicted dehydrogenase